MEINLNENGLLYKFNCKMWCMRKDYVGPEEYKYSRPKNLCNLFWHSVLNVVQLVIVLSVTALVSFTLLSPLSMLLNYIIDVNGKVLEIGACITFGYACVLMIGCIVALFSAIKQKNVFSYFVKGNLVKKEEYDWDTHRHVPAVYEDNFFSICFKFLANLKNNFCPTVSYESKE